MNRKERAENYTDGEDGLNPPTWGRIKRLIKLIPQIQTDFPVLETLDEMEIKPLLDAAPELGDIVISFYLMSFEKFRTISPGNYREECAAFAETASVEDATNCVVAIVRDWGAINASLVKLAESGKVPGLIAEQSPSRKQNSLQPASA